MSNHQWKAKWIWKNDKIEINQFAYFRKEIQVCRTVNKAIIFVSAHNHFELFVNGKKVNGYVTPAPTHPQKSKFYLSYDVTGLFTTGKNSICSVVHYLGGGGQNYIDGLPGFILECELIYSDNTTETIATDENWKVLGETPFSNGTGFQQNRRISAIEDYDACREDGWFFSGYNDSHWAKACLSPINDKGWVLKPQIIPEGNIYEIIVPEAAGVQENGVQVFDAGKIITGWPRIELKSFPGTSLKLRYSEDLTEEGRVKHNVCNENSENYYDCYRMKGSALETWEPCFSYKAFRYVEVTGYPEKLAPENIKIISAGTGLDYKGSFHCSNELLNKIYEACIQTQKNNVVGQIADCPHREQAQYLADSDLQAETLIYNFLNPDVLKKVLYDFKDGQFENGRFQFVFPSNSNPDFDIKIPEWDLHFCTLLWKTYYFYDDSSILANCYEAAKKMVGYYSDTIDEKTGLIPKGKGFPEEWNISDWPYPNIDETGAALTVQNCLYYHVLKLMSGMAGILGFENDRRLYMEQSQDMKAAIIKHLYNPEKKLFADSLGSAQYHQGTNVVAYQYGLVPEEDREYVLDFIISEGFGCSTLLSLNLLQVLFENGKGKEAYKLISRTDYPGWGYMIVQGYKTIWEGFQNIESHSHAWNAYPARIFAEYILGVKALAPGFGKIIIKPFIPEELRFADGKVPTIHGDMYVHWERSDGTFILKITVPAGCEAKVYLSGPAGTIYEAGEILWQNGNFNQKAGIRFDKELEGHITFSVTEGQYNFKADT